MSKVKYPPQKKSFKKELNSEEYGIKNKDILVSNIYSDITKWKHLYYKNIFNINIYIDTNIINNICFNYIKGIYWTYNYYKKIDIDYEWYYPYNYPASIKDIYNYIKVNEFEPIKSIGSYLNPEMQLLIILPKDSIQLISDKYKKYMLDISEGLYHLYPSQYKIQTFLKIHLWDCTPVLPNININKIKEIIYTK